MTGRILITGASGLLGAALLQEAPHGADIIAQVRRQPLPEPWRERASSVEQLDLNDEAAVHDLFRHHTPEAVIHTAARTNAGECEEHPDDARRQNVETTQRLLDLCRSASKPFVFISTDLVFDGRSAPYSENALRVPLGIYGQTKCSAEDVTLAYPKGLVARVSLLLGRSPAGNRSTDEALVAARLRGATVSLFHDEYRTPVHNVAAARLIWELLTKGATGLFHVAGRSRISRWDLGVALAKKLGLPEGILQRTSLASFTGRPPRPADCSLRTAKLESFLGRRAPTLEEMLELPIAKM